MDTFSNKEWINNNEGPIRPAAEGPSGLDDLLLLDRTDDFTHPDVLYPFALEELLCRHVGEGGTPLVHLWRHPRAFVMGLRDSRLPGATDAADWLQAQGYDVAVRNSGGAAVPLNHHVVNVSLILPKARQGEIDFRSDFEKMYALIGQALEQTGAAVDKGEIEGAYCPGDYDLSIGGRKFCGIAQRRQAHAYVVQAFVVAGGRGTEMAALARGFYERATAGQTDVSHPHVTADRTASLDELAGLGEAAAETFTAAVKRVIRRRQTEAGLARAAAAGLWLPAEDTVHAMVASLRQRYGIALV